MIRPRKYQLSIINTAYNSNTLVVLPTGLGKTLIAFLLARLFLEKKQNNGKVLFLAPTRPLVMQHEVSCSKILPEYSTTVFTGYIKSDKRSELFKEKDIIFSTPQGLENDIISNKINLKDVSLIVFDEAHRAVGNYSYAYIAKEYNKKNPDGRMLALTASPGSDVETVTEVCKNLSIKDLEYRTIHDPDVREYVQESTVTELTVEFPDELKKIQKILDICLKSKLKEIKEKGYLNFDMNSITRTKLLGLQASLSKEIIRGDRDLSLMRSVSLAAQALKIAHASELLETQDLNSLIDYFESLDEQSKKTKVKATINLVKDSNFITAKNIARQLKGSDFEHPKIKKLKELLGVKFDCVDNYKCIIFNQYRDSAISVYNNISNIPGAKPVLFFGQSKKKGMGHSQKEQKQIIDEFRNGDYNILIATSVAEEGLDIPSVNSVIFFEPVPSAIRSIQRRGRTARQDEGEIYVLLNKGTRDESYKWASYHKEKRMYRVMKDLKKELELLKFKNKSEKQKVQTLAESLSSSKVGLQTKLNADEKEVDEARARILNKAKQVKLNNQNTPGSLQEEKINPLFAKLSNMHAIDEAPIIQNQIVESDILLDDSPVKKEVETQLNQKSETLSQNGEPKQFHVIVDHREKGGNLIKELQDRNVNVILKSLDCGDYLLSEKVAVEYKLDDDFVNSIFDGRLFAQAKELSLRYLKPIMVVESEVPIIAQNKITNSQLFGVISSLMIDFNIPVIFTRSKNETIDLFETIMRREQSTDFKLFNPHASNKPKDMNAQVEYIVSALPSIGMSLAKALIRHFKSIRAISNANLEELQAVDKIGKTKAQYIYDVFNKRIE